MKNYFQLGSAVILFIFLGCGSQNEDLKKEVKISVTEKISDDGVAKNTASIGIEGMTCAVGCAKRIESKLNQTDGILAAKVLFDDKLAKIEFDDSKISEQEMVKLIEEMGDYAVNNIEVEKTVVKSANTSDTLENKGSKKAERNVEQVSHRNISFPNIFDVFTRLYRI